MRKGWGHNAGLNIYLGISKEKKTFKIFFSIRVASKNKTCEKTNSGNVDAKLFKLFFPFVEWSHIWD